MTASWPTIDGTLLRSGLDLEALPLNRACNVLYSLLAEGRDEMQRAQLDGMLSASLPGQVRGRPGQRDHLAELARHAEEDGALFMAALGQQSRR